MITKHSKNIIPNRVKRRIKNIVNTVTSSFKYLFKQSACNSQSIKHIVFVCKGNVCRSAFAEYYLKSLITEKDICIESCGLDVDQGVFASIEAVSVARIFGVDLKGHVSKGLSACDILNADLIVPMEYSQYLKLVFLYPDRRDKIHLLNEFAPWPFRLLCNIYDPFGQGEDEFYRCYFKMQRAIDCIIKRCHVAAQRENHE